MNSDTALDALNAHLYVTYDPRVSQIWPITFIFVSVFERLLWSNGQLPYIEKRLYNKKFGKMIEIKQLKHIDWLFFSFVDQSHKHVVSKQEDSPALLITHRNFSLLSRLKSFTLLVATQHPPHLRQRTRRRKELIFSETHHCLGLFSSHFPDDNTTSETHLHLADDYFTLLLFVVFSQRISITIKAKKVHFSSAQHSPHLRHQTKCRQQSLNRETLQCLLFSSPHHPEHNLTPMTHHLLRARLLFLTCFCYFSTAHSIAI